MKKKKNLLMIPLIILSVMTIALLVTVGIGYRRLKDNSEKLAEAKNEISKNTYTLYCANRNIKAGEIIQEEDIYESNMVTGLPKSRYITADDIGSRSIIDIQAETPIMRNMITTVKMADDTREYEIAAVNIMYDQANNDVVDIRILFPNGEDYVVLAKKDIKNLAYENSVFYSYLNEEEVVRMTSAIVDAYMTTGARLYTTRYVESNIQPDSIPNYPVRPETMDLIRTDPNILTNAVYTLNLSARLDLEKRLSYMSEDALSAVAAGFGISDTAKGSVMTDQGHSTEDEYGYEDEYEDEDEYEEDYESEDTEADGEEVE